MNMSLIKKEDFEKLYECLSKINESDVELVKKTFFTIRDNNIETYYTDYLSKHSEDLIVYEFTTPVEFKSKLIEIWEKQYPDLTKEIIGSFMVSAFKTYKEKETVMEIPEAIYNF